MMRRALVLCLSTLAGVGCGDGSSSSSVNDGGVDQDGTPSDGGPTHVPEWLLFWTEGSGATVRAVDVSLPPPWSSRLLGGSGIAWSPDRKHFLTGGSPTQVLSFETPTPTAIALGGSPSATDGVWGPSSSRFVVFESIVGGGGVRTLNAKGYDLTQPDVAMAAGFPIEAFAFSAKDDVFVYSASSAPSGLQLSAVDLRTVTPDPKPVTLATATTAAQFRWGVSPIDDRVIVNQPSPEIFSVAGGPHAPMPSDLADFRFFPDGTAIVYSSAAGLFLVDVSGATPAAPVKITDANVLPLRYLPSPDSQALFYLTGSPADLYVVRRSAPTAPTKVAGGFTDTNPNLGPSRCAQHAIEWTPDASALAYIDGAFDLFVVDTSRATPGTPAKLASNARGFCIADDGASIAYGTTAGIFVTSLPPADPPSTITTFAAGQSLHRLRWSKTNHLGYTVLPDGLFVVLARGGAPQAVSRDTDFTW